MQTNESQYYSWLWYPDLALILICTLLKCLTDCMNFWCCNHKIVKSWTIIWKERFNQNSKSWNEISPSYACSYCCTKSWFKFYKIFKCKYTQCRLIKTSFMVDFNNQIWHKTLILKIQEIKMLGWKWNDFPADFKIIWQQMIINR